MSKLVKLEKYLEDAKGFVGKGLTCGDSKFEAWNHGLLRFIKSNYDEETYAIFKNRSYSLSVWTMDTDDEEFTIAFDEDMKTTIEDLKILIEDEDNNVIDVKESPDKMGKNNNIEIILNLLNKFHMVCRQLLMRHESRTTIRIKDEYDVQDLLRSLLYIFFDDVRPEEWTPSYAGSCSRQDFLLKKEKIVIEIKKTRKGLQDRQIGEQLIVDIEKYKKHPDCKNLICFVYDPDGKIANPKGLENDLTRNTDGLNVIAIVKQ